MTADTVLLLQRIQNALQQHAAIGKTLSVINFMALASQADAGRPLTEYELTALYWTISYEDKNIPIRSAIKADLRFDPNKY